MPTVAATTLLDRCSPKRADEAWITEQKSAAAARFIVFCDLKPVIISSEDKRTGELRWLTRADVTRLELPDGDAMFLGLARETGVPHFAIAITDHRARTIPGALEFLRPAVDLRMLAMQGVLTPEEQSLAGQARALAQWHETAACCGKCGATMFVKDGGWRRKCSGCGTDGFPRTDPVVIMLVTDGERCILAHEYRYAAKMYSTLAGFLEPGEDIEYAVRREVLEETGIRVGRVAYHSSQPWPFPHSLMIGCIAYAENTDIVVDKSELEDARWFSKEDAAAMLAGRHPDGLTAPGRHAIAYRLVSSFVEGKTG